MVFFYCQNFIWLLSMANNKKGNLWILILVGMGCIIISTVANILLLRHYEGSHLLPSVCDRKLIQQTLINRIGTEKALPKSVFRKMAGAFVLMRWIEFPAITTGTSSDCREITSINAAKCFLLLNEDKAWSRQLIIVSKIWLRLLPFPIVLKQEDFHSINYILF